MSNTGLRHHLILFAGLVLLCGAGQALGQAPALQNDHVSLTLAPAAGYALHELQHRGQGVNLIAPPPEGATADRSPWIVQIRTADGTVHSLSSADAQSAEHRLDGDRLVVVFSGVGNEACPADLAVTMTIRLDGTSGQSYWRLNIGGTAPGELWLASFPRILGIRSLGFSQMALPYYRGRLFREPERYRVSGKLNYPAPASMQWLSWWTVPEAREPGLPEDPERIGEIGWAGDYSDAAGVYLATLDGEAMHKEFVYDARLEQGLLALWVENYPPLPTWPIAAEPNVRQVAYEIPYETAVTVFTGDYNEAGALYRAWAQDQPWCARGTLDLQPDEPPPAGSPELERWVPKWFRDVGFWAKFYHEPAKVLPEWAAFRKWLGVPMASHWYRYNIARFDDNYPEHLPGDPYLLEGIRDARDLGVAPLPYNQGVIWDTDTQSWIKENAFASAIKNEQGDFIPWDIHGQIFAYMCPGTEQWREKMVEVSAKMVVDHGMSGTYLDCLTASRSRLCYDTGHEHAVHGGAYYAQGQREMMRLIREETRRTDPGAAYFVEEIGEWVMDYIDGYLTLDLARSWCPTGQQVLPLYNTVYHPYTLNFGADAALQLPLDRFTWEMGTLLAWGSMPLHSMLVTAYPEAGEPKSEFTREVVQAYYQVARHHLLGALPQRLVTLPREAPAPDSSAGLELRADTYRVAYDLMRDRKRLWEGPAVIGSAWLTAAGDMCIILVNITDETQQANLSVRAGRLDLSPEARLMRAWPLPGTNAAAAPGAHNLSLPARTVAVYVLTDDIARATQATPLDEMPWELLWVEEEAEFPAVAGPPGSLWACSDGPVQNTLSPQGTTARALWFDENNQLVPRSGRQAQVRGIPAEGRGLPRETADKPFLLMRSLPLSVVTGEGDIMVYSADEHHLSCLIPGGIRLQFGEPGIILAADAATGELVPNLPDGPADDITLPAGGPFVFGYATLDTTGVDEAVRGAGDAAQAAWTALQPNLQSLRTGDTATRPERTAVVSNGLFELMTRCSPLPGALSPVTALTGLNLQVQALAGAATARHVIATSDHDWLAPGVPRDVQLIAIGGPAAAESAVVQPLGQWAPGSMETGNPRAEGTHTVAARVLLTDSDYVERMVPVVMGLALEADGRRYMVADVLHLKANRRAEIRVTSAVLTGVAGRTSSTEVPLRNWSPYPVTFDLSATGPDGFSFTPDPAQVSIPPLRDVTALVHIATPTTAQSGEYAIRITAKPVDDPGGELVAFRHMNLLPQLLPLRPDAPPAPEVTVEERARVRQSGKFIIYAQEGEELSIRMENVRVTIYTNTMAFTLQDPDLEVLEQGTIPVDEVHELRLTAPKTGSYHLEVLPGTGSTDVQISNQWWGELATKLDPVQLFGSSIKRWFYVPEGVESFVFGAQDGGPDETARVILTSPTGRVAFDFDGYYNSREFDIAVEDGESGDLWTLECIPRQDFALWLGRGACSVISPHPNRVLVEAAMLTR